MARIIRAAFAAALVTSLFVAATASAEEIANEWFERTWERTDRPVAELQVSRTWMWGPEPFTGAINEDYEEGENNQRVVQYFDKSRMELTTDTEVSQESEWYVTNGLLATEMITGELQLGNDTFEQHLPADIPVAGDPDDTGGPTYVTFTDVVGADALAENSTITQTIDREGTVGDDATNADYEVTAGAPVVETGHGVASVFWDFMTSSGLVYQNGEFVEDKLFPIEFYWTGYPITEAYWSDVKVAGEVQDVLVQCFERRCLTYAPGNPEGWQVEAGNIGQHYYHWRYDMIPNEQQQLSGTLTVADDVVSIDGETQLTATVTDAFGQPVDGVTVNFEITDGADFASLGATSAETGADGVASVTLTGIVAGELIVRAYVEGDDGSEVELGTVTVMVATVGEAASGTTSADVETLPIGDTGGAVITTTVLDAFDNPVTGAQVCWEITGPATSDVTCDVTGADGTATATVTLEATAAVDDSITVQAFLDADEDEALGDSELDLGVAEITVVAAADLP